MARLVRSKRRLQFTIFAFHPVILRHNEFQELKRYLTPLYNENVGDSAVSICLMFTSPQERNTHKRSILNDWKFNSHESSGCLYGFTAMTGCQYPL